MTRTPAQHGRQRTRDGGKYSAFPECQGECGRRVNPDAYCSHAMTDCVDANGEGFGDLAILLCAYCSRVSGNPAYQTVAAWNAYVAKNVAKRAAK